MTIMELRRELETLERAGFGDLPIYAYDGTGKFVDLSAEQIVGHGVEEAHGFRVTEFYLCSPEHEDASA